MLFNNENFNYRLTDLFNIYMSFLEDGQEVLGVDNINSY